MPRIAIPWRLAVVVSLMLLIACTSAPTSSMPSITNSTIIAGVPNYAPGFAVGDLNPAGFDIDLMNAISRGLNTPVAPTFIASKDRASTLKSKKATIIIHTFSITKERNLEGIDFAGPYMVNPQAILIRAHDEPNIVTSDHLAGKSVCTVATTTGSGVNIPGAIMDTQPSTIKECVDLLDKGGTDAVFTDALVLYGYTHAYPGKFKVILSGVFGELQYYGVGLLGGRHADCLKLNKVIKDYLDTQWRHDFQDTLPDAAAAYTGSNINSGDFESQFKPKDTDMTSLSCKL